MVVRGKFHTLVVSQKDKKIIKGQPVRSYGIRIKYFKQVGDTSEYEAKISKMWRMIRYGDEGKAVLEGMVPGLKQKGNVEGLTALLEEIEGKKAEKSVKKSRYPNVSYWKKGDKWEAMRVQTGGKRTAGKKFEDEDHAGVVTLCELYKAKKLDEHLKPGSPMVELLKKSGVWVQRFFDSDEATIMPGDVVSHGDEHPIAVIDRIDGENVKVAVFTMMGGLDGQTIISVDVSESVHKSKPDVFCIPPMVSITIENVEYIGWFTGFEDPWDADDPDKKIARVVVLKEPSEGEADLVDFRHETILVPPLEVTFQGRIGYARLVLHADALRAGDWSRLFQ